MKTKKEVQWMAEARLAYDHNAWGARGTILARTKAFPNDESQKYRDGENKLIRRYGNYVRFFDC